MEVTIFGHQIYDLLWWLWIYSFLGWAFECTYVAIHEGRMINRGFAVTPFCPIYGCGAVLIMLTLGNFEHNLIMLFVMSVILTSLLELVVYVILDKVFHMKWWDYSDLRFHFKGILSLESSLAWGVLAVVLVKILHPVVRYLITWIPRGIGTKLVIGITVIYAVDFILCCLRAIRRSESSSMIILRVKTETVRRIVVGFFKRKK